MGASPAVRFVTTDDGVRIAWSSHGEGPPLVFVRGWITHLELLWGDEPYRRFFELLGRQLRVVRFDARGNGLSDRAVTRLDLDGLLSDVEAVMDGLGLNEATIWGSQFGGPIAVAYAARHPDRVAQLILDDTFATLKAVGTPDRRDAFLALLTALRTEPAAAIASFSYLQDPDPAISHARRVERSARSINADIAVQLFALAAELDISDLLPAVGAPTLVLHRRRATALPLQLGRTVASLIPDAQLQVLEGTASNPWEERPEDALRAIATFLGLEGGFTEGDELMARTADLGWADSAGRVLATVLFTDIVGSTERAEALGDAGWRALLDAYDHVVGEEIESARGRKIKDTGDGTLAIFDGPARAVRCARAIRGRARTLGIKVRAGVHTGEVELVKGDVRGIAVHITARITSRAQPGEVLVSGTVRDLAVGSDIPFADRGAHTLKGIAGTFQLFAAYEAPDGAAPGAEQADTPANS